MVFAVIFGRLGRGHGPPAWFGAGEGSADDVAARSEDLPSDGFGHPGVIVCDTEPLVAAALSVTP